MGSSGIAQRRGLKRVTECGRSVTGKAVQKVTMETEPLFCFHHVNAFESGDGRVIVDCLAMKGGVDFGANFGNLSAGFFQGAPWRTALTQLTLDLEGNKVRAPLKPSRIAVS